MNIDFFLEEIINKSEQKDEISISMAIIQYFISKNLLFSKFKPFNELKSKIETIKSKKKLYVLNFISKSDSSNLFELIKSKAFNEKNILNCPDIDEYSIFLAALKILEEKTGKDLGYKNILREFIINHIHLIEKEEVIKGFIGREKEIEKIKRVIEKDFKNNVLIIGPTGIGKTAILKKNKR